MNKLHTIISLVIISGFLFLSGCTDDNFSSINEDETVSYNSVSDFTDFTGNSSVLRSLPAGCINPGEIIMVNITVSEYGFGILKETLCDGWTFINSSLDPVQVEVNGSEIVFALLGETDFSYNVKAPLSPGENCTIIGNFTDMNNRMITGESSVCIS